jgi:antitoxin Xre/MbcA/ParS-like protein
MASLVKRGTPRSVGRVAQQSFAEPSDRRRLTAAGLQAVRNLAECWGLTGDEAAALLGVSASTWDRIRAGSWAQALSQDQFTRVSALVGIYKALHLLFADDMADRWPRLANSGPLFANRSPIEAMIGGGIPLMLDVRRYVDALRGGL